MLDQLEKQNGQLQNLLLIDWLGGEVLCKWPFNRVLGASRGLMVDVQADGRRLRGTVRVRRSSY